MIAIPTYNRKSLISCTSLSLSYVRNLNYDDVYVFDDCSDEYDENFLKSIYPGANVIVSPSNLGADKNIEKAYRYFLDSDYDYFFNADSDILFSENIISIIENIIGSLNEDNPILFSLFHTKNHFVIGEYNQDLFFKKDVGACGTIFNKKAILLFIDKLPLNYDKQFPSVDHAFCSIYKEYGRPVLCTKKSYVQHIGIHGQNSNDFQFDYGVGFPVENLVNAKAILDLYEKNFPIESYDMQQKILKLAEDGRFGVQFAFRIFVITLKNKIKKVFRRYYDKKIH